MSKFGLVVVDCDFCVDVDYFFYCSDLGLGLILSCGLLDWVWDWGVRVCGKLCSDLKLRVGSDLGVFWCGDVLWLVGGVIGYCCFIMCSCWEIWFD